MPKKVSHFKIAMSRLYDPSSHLISIVYGDAAGADEDANLLKAQVRDEPKTFRPIAPMLSLPQKTPDGSPAISAIRGDAISKSFS